MATPTIKELLTAIAERQAMQLDRCRECRAKVEDHDATLNGSKDSMGLRSKVAIVFWVLSIVGSAATIALAAVAKSALGL